MSKHHATLPRPYRRLLRTLCRTARNLRTIVPRISFEEAARQIPDSEEAAHWGEVILLEDLAVVLHRDGTTSWRTHSITMPWGDQNLAEWDEIIRVYPPFRWHPTVRRAVVHLPDGTQRKAKKKVASASTTERGLSLTFAPLRPGVIVEFEEQVDYFRTEEVGPAMWAQYLLQTMCPCRQRRITVAVAEPFKATIQSYNTDLKPSESSQRGYHIYRWLLHDVEGIETDMWTPPPRDFVPWVDISTLTAWDPVVQHYRKELIPNRPVSQQVQELASDLASSASGDREKVEAVYRYAARDVRYGRHPSELQMHSVREPGKMLEDLRGDCKDKSSLMVSLLKQLDIPAQIAVVLTAQNGRTPILPSLRFDHAIVLPRVDGQDLWLDPASGPYTLGDLPQNDQGVKALILDDAEPSFIDVPMDDPARQAVQRICQGQLNEQGDYQFDAEVTAQGERAAMHRMNLTDRNEDHCQRLIQQSVAEERPGAMVDEVKLGDVKDIQHNVTYGYRVKLAEWARRIQDLLLFRIPWAEPVDFSGPVSAAVRLQPLQTPAVMRLEERHEIAIPAGFTGYGLPFEVKNECQWANYSCHVTCEDGRLVCQRRMDTRGGIVPTDHFAQFKSFWEACARSDRSDIVLMKNQL